MAKSTKQIEKLSFIEKYKILTEDDIDLDKRIIYLCGDLNDDLGTILRIKYEAIKLYYKDQFNKVINDITLDISSFGGSIYSINAALDFYDEALNENILVNTRAQGVCMSAATVLLSGGTGTRIATKRCKLMLHDIQAENIGGSATQVIEHVRILQKEQEELFQFYVQFSRERNTPELEGVLLKQQTKKWMKKFADNSLDHYISSQEALSLKLIDKII